VLKRIDLQLGFRTDPFLLFSFFDKIILTHRDVGFEKIR